MTTTTTAAAPLFDESGNYNPAPGEEHPFSISDIARATARVLGPGWLAEAGFWGVCGNVSGPYVAEFEFLVDHDGDLCITFTRYEADGFPEDPELPEGVEEYDNGVFLPGASVADGLEALAEQSAAVIRVITGYDPAAFDFESSASRQHFIDIGRYLRRGDADQA